jgi:hypothetical protein
LQDAVRRDEKIELIQCEGQKLRDLVARARNHLNLLFMHLDLKHRYGGVGKIRSRAYFGRGENIRRLQRLATTLPGLALKNLDPTSATVLGVAPF